MKNIQHQPVIRRLNIKGLHVTPTLLSDGYKMDHRRQYIPGTKYVTANMTPRKSRIPGCNEVIVFGIQYYLISTLIERWTNDFFALPIEDITAEYVAEMTEYTLSKESALQIGTEHWKALHQLGYLPLEIRALEEGTHCPIKVPVYMIKNTHPDFFWLTNFIETDMSAETWGTMTAATLANQYRKIFTAWAIKTGADLGFVPFQGHNFSYRGMLGREAAAIVDMGHCTSFMGSDSVHGRKYFKHYYNGNQTGYNGNQTGFNDIISCSVFATEHAVMTTAIMTYEQQLQEGQLNHYIDEYYAGQKILADLSIKEIKTIAEYITIKRLITEVYPSEIVSLVCDSFDLWAVLTEILPRLKDIIMARDGKVVIRPDSGDPVDIMCGWKFQEINNKEEYEGKCKIVKFENKFYTAEFNDNVEELYFTEIAKQPSSTEIKGVIELLWDIFGGTTELGADGKIYKFLDSHIGAIYGDSINLERAEAICQRLADKGFGSTNWIAGIGSYTYQYVTRDTFGFAQKATFAEIEINDTLHGIEVFKNPITDDGTKKSARGRLRVDYNEQHEIFLKDQCTEEEESGGLLELVFLNSKLIKETNLEKIRAKIKLK